MNSILVLTITATLIFTPFVSAKDRNDLTAAEKEMVGHLYAKVRHQEKVTKAREAHEAAVRHYHEVLRKAMIAKKPEIEPALAKIRMNPGLLADAIWQRRNRDFLKTLDFPMGSLSNDERDRWNRAMSKLRSSPTTQTFSKGLEANRQRQAQLRKEQGQAFSNFRSKAREQLSKIDGGLKPIFEKFDQKKSPASSASDKPDTKLPHIPDLNMPEVKMPDMPMPDFDQEC